MPCELHTPRGSHPYPPLWERWPWSCIAHHLCDYWEQEPHPGESCQQSGESWCPSKTTEVGAGLELMMVAPKSSLDRRERIRNEGWGDFPGGPVVKMSPSKTGGALSIPGQRDPRSYMPCGQKKKTSPLLLCNILLLKLLPGSSQNVLTNSIRTLKMVH